MKPHDLLPKTDPDGREVVGVRLSNHSERAWLYRADYDRIVERYGTVNWRLTPNGQGRFYIRFKQLGQNARNVTAAREVAGDLMKTGVRYRDGDMLNLRSTNLHHDNGRGGRGNKCLRFPVARSRATAVKEAARV